MTADTPTTQVIAAEDDEIDLRELVDVILQHRWLGIFVATIVVLLGCLYLFVATPIYKVDALIQTEKQQPLIPGMESLQDAFGSNYGYASAQIEVIKSRSVLSRVVSELKLDTRVRPVYTPVFGEALARRGFDEAMRNVSIKVSRFDVPDSLKGQTFILTAGKEGEYRLQGPEAGQTLAGKAGELAKAKLLDGTLELFVQSISAPKGVEFAITKNHTSVTVQDLQSRLTVSEKGKMTGVLSLTFTGPDPVLAKKTLTSIINNYVRLNVEMRSEQAEKSLEFLNKQLPSLKQEVANAEAALQAHKKDTGSAIDLSVEGQEILEQATQLETRISDLQIQRSELRARFTEEAPAIKTIDKQLAQLKASRSGIESRLKKMPATELQSIRLMRNVQVANELYIQLLNKAQEFKVAKAGTIGDARILDVPVLPQRKDKPKTLLVLALTLMLAMMAGVMAIFIRRFLMRTLETPDAIEAQLGLSVFSTIPHSAVEAKNQRRGKKGTANLLANISAHDPAVESLRSLRTSLQFAQLEAKNNIISIHGPTPEIGKSFVASNLAFLLGETEKKVLLIDADLRKGHLHRTLGKPREPGLSGILTGRVTLEEAAHPFEEGTVNFLASGRLPPNPAELLVHENFQKLLNSASSTYDYVIIDTPPTLNLADSISIGKLSGVNFLVVRGGINTLQDVRLCQRRMDQNGIKVDGVIFNDLSVTAAKYHYGRYYQYQYSKSLKHGQ